MYSSLPDFFTENVILQQYYPGKLDKIAKNHYTVVFSTQQLD